MNIAIIPSRIGSKRLKKKNIKKFLGNPIILVTLKNLIESKLFNKIIVSSDSNIILKICKKKFNIILHKRDKKYSTDKSTTIEAIKSCIDDKKILDDVNICCVYPCAPMIDTNDLKKTKSILKKNKNFFILPVKKYIHPIERSFTLSSKNIVKNIKHKNSISRTQNFLNSYHDVGQFYWGKARSWKKNKSILPKAIGYPTNKIEYIDIDNKEDWVLAEKIFKFIKKNK